jgi:hypothetical protein
MGHDQIKNRTLQMCSQILENGAFTELIISPKHSTTWRLLLTPVMLTVAFVHGLSQILLEEAVLQDGDDGIAPRDGRKGHVEAEPEAQAYPHKRS